MESTQWCFHQMAQNWPQHLMTKRCDCGMAKQVPKLLSFKGTRIGQLSGVFTRWHKAGLSISDKTVRLWDGQTGSRNCCPSKGTRIGQVSGFHQMARNWPQHLLTEQCDCGMAKQAPKLLSFEGHSDWGQLSGVFTRWHETGLSIDDKTVRLWDGQTGAEIAVLRGHSDWVNSVVFSPDGTKLASASDDRNVRLWDGQTGAKLLSFKGTRIGSTQWCFHRMAQNWPQHLMTERCDCGMAKQAPKLLSFEGTRIGSTQWCFHRMARDWPQHL
jgi:WD40 repeat protein